LRPAKNPTILLALVIVIWGLNYVAGRCLSSPVLFGYIHITGVLLGFLRYLAGAIFMAVILLAQRRRPSAVLAHLRPYRKPLALSVLASSVFVLAAHQSQAYISSGTTSVIINLCPILVLTYSVWSGREELSPRKAAGFALGALGGLLFLARSLQAGHSAGSGLGLLLALAAMLAWAAYTVAVHSLAGADRIAVLAVQHTVSTLLIAPFVGICLLRAPLTFVPDAWSLLGVLFAGAVSSGLAYILYFQAIAALGASRAAAFLFLVPLVSLLGDLILGELPHAMALLGGLLALTGIALIKSEDGPKIIGIEAMTALAQARPRRQPESRIEDIP